MFVKILTIFAMLVLLAEAEKSSEVAACADCMHLSYEVRNVPSYYSAILDSVLSSKMNPACVANTVQQQTCEPLQFPAWTEHKCLTTKVTLTASNLKGFIPNAEMDVTVTVRGGCHEQWGTDSDEDECISLSELDENTRKQITQQFASFSTRWESVSYSGEVCRESP